MDDLSQRQIQVSCVNVEGVNKRINLEKNLEYQNNRPCWSASITVIEKSNKR